LSPDEPKADPKPLARRLALGVLQLAVTVAVTIFIVKRVGLGLDDLAGLDAERWRPSVGLFLLSCLALLGGYVASAGIWSRMVADMGGPSLPLGAATEVYLIANLGRYVPGKLWQIAGLAVLARQRGVPVAVSTAAAVLGQAVALGGAALVGTLALLGRGEPLGGWSVLALAILAGLVGVALVPPLQRWAIRLWFRIAGHAGETVRTSPATTLGWLVLYTLNWILYAAAFLLLVRSFALPGPAAVVGSAFAAAYVLGYAAVFAPAGIGVREGFLVFFLSPVMGVGPAGVVSILARLWTTVLELLPAGVLWLLHVRRTLAPPVGDPAEPPRSS
jgi:hypothetical protein